VKVGMIHEYAAKRQKYKDSKPITCMAKKRTALPSFFDHKL
jgi:hypothetical protein